MIRLICKCLPVFQKENSENALTVIFKGPSQCGKSSLIYFLKNRDYMKSPSPTKSITETIINYESQIISLKEDPQQESRIIADGWVYVIDVLQDHQENIKNFIKSLSDDNPVLLCINKSDLEGYSLDTGNIAWGSRKYLVIQTDKKGEGIEKGFLWLINEIINKQKEGDSKIQSIINQAPSMK